MIHDTSCIQIEIRSNNFSGADPGFGVRGGKIRQVDMRVLLLLSQKFMERMMQENEDRLAGYYD